MEVYDGVNLDGVSERGFGHILVRVGMCVNAYNWRVLVMVCGSVLRGYGCICIVCTDCEYSR